MRIRLLAVPSIVAGAALLMLVLGSAPATATDISGDLVVTGSDVRSNDTINLTGSLIVSAGGSLTWTDVNLYLVSSTPGQYGIFIDGSATFTRVTFRAADSANPYIFRLNSTASVQIEGSDIADMYGQAGDPGSSGAVDRTNFGSLVGGVEIYSSNVRIGNSSIHDGWGANLYVSNASPRVNNNKIYAAHFIATEYSSSFAGSTQTSYFRAIAVCVLLASGSTDLDTDLIYGCGKEGSANATDLGTMSPTNAVSHIYLVGAGLGVLGGSPNLRQTSVTDSVTISQASKSFLLGSVSVTHNFYKLASWGIVSRSVPTLTISGGYVSNADTLLQVYANSTYTGGAINVDLYGVTFNGTFLSGFAANFGGLSVPITVRINTITVAGPGNAALTVHFTSISAAHDVIVTSSTISGMVSGSGIVVEDSSSSGGFFATLSVNSITRTRSPIAFGLLALTGGATTAIHNNTINLTAGAVNGSAVPSTRGGIDVRWISLSGGVMSLLVEDNKVFNQSWQLGAPYPGLTVYSTGAFGVTNSLTVRRNVFSNVSYGMYIEEDYGLNAQSSSHVLTHNRVETSSSDGGFLRASSNGGPADPTFDWNTFYRSNGLGFAWELNAGFIPTKTFTNNTIIGNGTAVSNGFSFSSLSTAKWNLYLYDMVVLNASSGFRFTQMNVNVYRSNVSSTLRGIVCADCVARVEQTAIFRLSADVTGTNAEVTVYFSFGAPRVQWQADGGILINSGNLFLRWYGPTVQTLATIALDGTGGSVSNRSVPGWRVRPGVGNSQEFANLTPVIRVAGNEVIGIPVSFMTDFYANLTLLDPELPSLRYTTPAAGAQIRDRDVTVKGQATDATTGIEVVQISTDGSNFTGVDTYDPFTGEWEHKLTGLPDGRYNITLRAWDRARWAVTFGDFSSGFAEAVIAGVVIDTTPPTIDITDPSQGITINKTSYLVRGIAYDANTITVFKVKDISVSRDNVGNWQILLTNLTEGPNLILVLATDLAGNTNIMTRTIVVDRTPPYLVVLTPANNSFTNRDAIDVRWETEADVVVEVNGVPHVQSTIYRLRQGENYIWINATDRGANKVSFLRVVTLDTLSPTVVFVSPARFPFATNSPRIVLQAKGSEPLSAVFVENISYPLTDRYNFSIELYLEDGIHYLSLRIIDLANNSAEVTPAPIIVVDTVPPSLRIDSPEDRSVQPTRSILIRGHTDPCLPPNPANCVSLNVTTPSGRFALGANAVTGEFTFEETRPFDGVFIYTFEASDLVGNRQTTGIQITVDTTAPSLELTGIPPDPNFETTDEYLRLHGIVSPGTSVRVNDKRVALECTTGPSATCTFDFLYPLQAGTNAISVVAIDAAGNTAVKNIFVKRNVVEAAPPADFSPVLIFLGLAAGIAMMPLWNARLKRAAKAKHPGLALPGEEAHPGVPGPVPAQVIYEVEQDIYTQDYAREKPRRPPRPPGGV